MFEIHLLYIYLLVMLHMFQILKLPFQIFFSSTFKRSIIIMFLINLLIDEKRTLILLFIKISLS